ncbi:MAG: response regulator [Phenylobacterium sp.]|uniref:response regulator n=1 Tax=Phenylobacterium sp. TaxID=1871053 RepID=UPI001A62BC1F|nr:response regulator [Phenylobacterium sp.]MBL8774004.1 response regulator [Phenylobacterium sp.]
MPRLAAARPLVLLVEDDIAVREALRFGLRVRGCEVELASSTDDLLARVAALAPSVLVVDANMRGASAIDVVEALRRQGDPLPIVLMATLPPRQLRRRANRAAALLLEKPVLGDRLAQAVSDLLARNQGSELP